MAQQALDLSKDEIRLLRLDLSNLAEKRQHRLISNVSLRSGRRKYVALSYPWGDREKSTRLMVDGTPLPVTTNLTNALDDVIQFWRQSYANRDEEFYLWTDQLCINQRDREEKSHQVRMMGDIFRRAEEVLVWLPLTANIQSTFSGWQDWVDWHKLQLEPNQPSRDDEMVYSPTSARSSGEYPIITAPDRRDRDSMLAWSNIHKILESPWWSRAWILQESLGPEKATFLVQGGFSIPWNELSELLARFFVQRKNYSKLLEDKEESLKQQDFQIQGTTKTPGFFDQCCGSKEDSRNQRNLSSSEQNARKQQMAFLQNSLKQHTQSDESWQITNYVLGSRAKRLKNGPEHYSLLSELMKHGRDCHSSEPRDKIYAFLGLASPAYGITADYNCSENTVFIETARAIITQERRLDILAIARENRDPQQSSDSLPSWVPDWSAGHTANLEYKRFLREVKFPVSTCRASQDSQAEVTFQNRFIEVKGIRADRLVKKVEDPPYRPYRRFSTEDGRDVSTVSSAKVGDEVWIFFGANEPFTLRKGGPYYIILGHAMIHEAGRPSPILDGALIDGRLSPETIQIT